MRILNAGCGGQRVQDERFVNLDTLHEQLIPGSPERTNLDQEKNYCNCNLLTQSIPFPDEHFDAAYLLHVLEHFTCQDAVSVIISCRRVLKPGGLLLASVPDVSYFRSVHDKDTRDNAIELFGESISGDWQDSQCNSFFEYGLWHRQHKQILNEDGLWALLRKAGFENRKIGRFYGRQDFIHQPRESQPWWSAIAAQLNRLRFSAILYAYK
jgi:SAM-dependent methyltransferase